jgi:hypothetical protein
MSRRKPSLTATQINEQMTGFFNYGSDVNIGYLRKPLATVDTPRAIKAKTGMPVALAATPAATPNLKIVQEAITALNERGESNTKAAPRRPRAPKKKTPLGATVPPLSKRAAAARKRRSPSPPKPAAPPPARNRVLTQRAVESAHEERAGRRLCGLQD